MRRVSLLLLCVALVLVITGCGRSWSQTAREQSPETWQADESLFPDDPGAVRRSGTILRIDGRSIRSGRNLHLSGREIHLIGPLVIPGGKVYIQAHTIHANMGAVIDVSGADGESWLPYKAKDGSAPGEAGANGRDGRDGEDGGRIVILAQEIKGALTLRANGGDGGAGQAGGNGAKGAPGERGKDGINKPELTRGKRGGQGGPGGQAGSGGSGGDAGDAGSIVLNIVKYPPARPLIFVARAGKGGKAAAAGMRGPGGDGGLGGKHFGIDGRAGRGLVGRTGYRAAHGASDGRPGRDRYVTSDGRVDYARVTRQVYTGD